MSGRFEEITHTADVGLRVAAMSFPELLEVAAEGMFTLMYGARRGTPQVERRLQVAGAGHVGLLWDWLSALLSWSEVDRASFWDTEVEVVGDTASGVARGPSVDGLELVGPPIKAVTYHQLSVAVHGVVWEATIIFDV